MGMIRGEAAGSDRSTGSRGTSARVMSAWLMAVGAVLLGGSAAFPAAVDEAPPASGPVGTLRGSVTLGRELSAHRMRFSLYADPHHAGVRSNPPSLTEELQNVVVYLEHVPGGPAAPDRRRDPARMEQEGLSFKPHVLAVVKGTEVEFPNRDMLFHNVFSLSKNASFDLGRFAQNASKSVRFTTPGIVKVFCHIHSDMSGVIVVLDNPFYASPGADGQFVIDGIPPGEYRVIAWHERARMAAKTIRIEAGGDSVLDFVIPLTEDVDGE
jgi:plastocyanin